MRAAVVYYSEKHKVYLRDIAKALAKGIESQGIRVDVVNAREFSNRLTSYQFVAFGTEASGTFGGQISPDVSKFLKRTVSVSGIRSFGFIARKGMRCGKSLLSLMKAMEAEGMFLLSSDVIGGSDVAEDIGKKLIIKS